MMNVDRVEDFIQVGLESLTFIVGERLIMRFDLKKICKNCPFRDSPNMVLLRPGRTREIRKSVGVWNGDPFTCHNHLGSDGKEEQHCLGALVLNEREGTIGQMQRICERIRMTAYTSKEILALPQAKKVPKSWAAWVKLQAKRNKELLNEN